MGACRRSSGKGRKVQSHENMPTWPDQCVQTEYAEDTWSQSQAKTELQRVLNILVTSMDQILNLIGT